MLSGGLDSSTVLAMASQNFSPYALTIFYGQRNHIEMAAAKRVAQAFDVAEHKTLELNLSCFGGSSLTTDAPVPVHVESSDIPQTYVPARNTIMLSLALAYAETVGAVDIFFGAHIHDYSGYPDCRPAYVAAFENMANLATAHAVNGQKITIHAPLINLSKSEIIKRGLALGLDYGITHSCYDPVGDLACGKCSACHYRAKGFAEALVVDPTRYVGRT